MGVKERKQKVDVQFSKVVAGSSEGSFDYDPLGKDNYENTLVIESREPVYDWDPRLGEILCKSKRTILKE